MKVWKNEQSHLEITLLISIINDQIEYLLNKESLLGEMKGASPSMFEQSFQLTSENLIDKTRGGSSEDVQQQSNNDQVDFMANQDQSWINTVW